MSMPVPRRLKEEVLLAPGIDPFGTDARESAESWLKQILRLRLAS
jgi:hypothetical protein